MPKKNCQLQILRIGKRFLLFHTDDKTIVCSTEDELRIWFLWIKFWIFEIFSSILKIAHFDAFRTNQGH